jgi:predicted O-linked N-acetylglucosamine transferase (SPINDLY family)
MLGTRRGPLKTVSEIEGDPGMPLPPCKIHQYYEPRILPGKVSRMDGQPFGHLTRRDFDLPENVTLYLCMQKPFKVHPEFDHLV